MQLDWETSRSNDQPKIWTKIAAKPDEFRGTPNRIAQEGQVMVRVLFSKFASALDLISAGLLDLFEVERRC